jgi:hypothetical protein
MATSMGKQPDIYPAYRHGILSHLQRPAIEFVLQVLCCTALAVVLQIAAGAYRAEFVAYPDEAAHVVTSISLDNYIRSGFHEPPREFFEDYYLHYPKVAMGHWPPLLYIIHSIGTLLFGTSRGVLMAVQALLAGILAAFVFRNLTGLVGAWAAAAGTGAFLMLRIVQMHASMAMAEILLTLTMFLAALSFAKFAESHSTADAVAFGVWASAAILTKGTGWALVMIPPIVLVLTHQWRQMLRPKLWLAALMVAVICLPWQFATAKMAAIGWDQPSPSVGFAWKAAVAFARTLFQMTGVVITCLALVAVLFAVLKPWRSAGVSPLSASLFALVVCDLVFHIAVPAGTEIRKLLIAVPALFVLAGSGALCIAARLVPGRSRTAAAWIFTAGALVAAATSPPVVAKPSYGYPETARALLARMPAGSAALVSSQGDGEGALISEMALLSPTPERYIVRASKLLTSQGWNGENYLSLVKTPEECDRLLNSVPISFLVLDHISPGQSAEHHRILEALVRNRPAEWIPIGRFSCAGCAGPMVELYLSAHGALPIRHLVIDMRSIGRKFETFGNPSNP